jgi:hypothetical protein
MFLLQISAKVMSEYRPLAGVPLGQRAAANVTPVIMTKEYFDTWKSAFAHPFAVSNTRSNE